MVHASPRPSFHTSKDAHPSISLVEKNLSSRLCNSSIVEQNSFSNFDNNHHIKKEQVLSSLPMPKSAKPFLCASHNLASFTSKFYFQNTFDDLAHKEALEIHHSQLTTISPLLYNIWN